MAALLLKRFPAKLSVFYNFCVVQQIRFVIWMNHYEKISYTICDDPVLLFSAGTIRCTTT